MQMQPNPMSYARQGRAGLDFFQRLLDVSSCQKFEEDSCLSQSFSLHDGLSSAIVHEIDDVLNILIG
jgi:hypothetical protein